MDNGWTAGQWMDDWMDNGWMAGQWMDSWTMVGWLDVQRENMMFSVFYCWRRKQKAEKPVGKSVSRCIVGRIREKVKLKQEGVKEDER